MRSVPLSQVGRIVTGKTPKTSTDGFFGGGIPFVTPSDMAEHRKISETGRTLSDAGVAAVKNCVIPPGSVMVSCIGSDMGKAHLSVCRSVTNQQINTVIVDDHQFDPLFVYYNLYGRRSQLREMAAGAAQPILNKTEFGKVVIDFPPLPEQREIAAILGALDDKIELNRKTAATLEAMARALYRSWFVDFDPVWAKTEGRTPAHMDEATAALFPDSFGDDGLPLGWSWSEFAEFYEVLETGKRPKGGIKDTPDGVPSIGAESIKKIGIFDFGKTKRIPREFFNDMRKGHLSDGDILIYKDGGKPGELRPAVTYVSEGFPFREACINEHVFRVRLGKELGQHFGFLTLSDESCMNQMRELATGVAQPGLNQSAMKSLSFIKPHQTEILSLFNALTQPLLDGCNEKANESQALASIRDTLLPKLMSGELRVREAQELVEEVA